MDKKIAAQTSPVHSGLFLNDVTIIDTHDGKLTSRMTIILEDGKITQIVPFGSVVAGDNAQSIEAHGKFVVPGYWEMHGHPFNQPNLEDSLALMLANGITGIRQMAGSPELLQRRKDGKLVPTADSPELLALPGDLLLRNNAGTPQDAIAEVQKQKRQGADFIKTIDVTPEAFFASLEEAKRQGLPYAGHLSPGVSATKASEEGMHAIEHLGAGEQILVQCSTDESAVREAIARLPPPPSPVLVSSAGVMNQKIALAAPVLAASLSDSSYVPRVQHLIDTFSEAKCSNVAEVFLAHHTWQVPTLIRLRTSAFASDPAYSASTNLRYASPATRQLFEAVAERYSSKLPPASQETLHRMFALQSKITKLFDQAGVKMLAGSDFGGSVWEIAGFSLHQEFDLLAQAGLSPLTILQMTTLLGAEFFNRQTTDGSVEEGKNANLVLLDDNPVEDARNLHKISAVIRGGTYYSHDALETLKQKAAEHLASSSTPEVPA